MTPISLTLVDQYWGNFLGCESELIRAAQNTYLAVPEQPGLWAFTRGTGWIVATPADWCAQHRAQIGACFQPNQLPNCAELHRSLPRIDGQNLYGPAAIFLHHRANGAVNEPAVRPLTHKDQAAITAFAAVAGPLPWSLQQPDIWRTVFGLFLQEKLVATCGVCVWGELLAEIYVDTAPAYRRRGYGKAVTTAALEWIHTATPYYAESVVELSNQPSLELMKSLGFEPYGYMITSHSM